jgi:hypothetical protein
MFEYNIYNECNYHLVGTYKNKVIHCGSYNKINNDEIITCLNTGKCYYRINEFLEDIHGLNTRTPLTSFMIYDDKTSRWTPLTMILI